MSIRAILAEIDQEGTTTRRVLERVPSDKLAWRPHPKSMSLGELAMHIAGTPGVVAEWATHDVKEFGTSGGAPQPASTDEIVAAHDASVAKAKTIIGQLGEEGLKAQWKAQAGGQTLFAMPKAVLVRMIVLNHWYHHRGQLSVYLRLLDVAVPAIYGPSADENPFAAARA